MTVAPHPISQSRSLSFQPRAGPGRAMSSASLAEPLHASTRARAAHLHDRTSSPSSFRSTQSSPRRFRTDPGAPSATRKIPIGRALQSPSSPRFPPWEAFDAGLGAASTVAMGRRPNPSPTEASRGAVRYVRSTSILLKNLVLAPALGICGAVSEADSWLFASCGEDGLSGMSSSPVSGGFGLWRLRGTSSLAPFSHWRRNRPSLRMRFR